VSFGGFVVACFQARSHLAIHLTGASIFFAFSLFVILSQVYIDRQSQTRNIGKNLRVILAMVAVGSLVTLGIQALVVLAEFKCDISRGTPEGLKLPMSVMELLFFATCLGVYGTMIPAFKAFRLRVSVVNVEEVAEGGSVAMKTIVWDGTNERERDETTNI